MRSIETTPRFEKVLVAFIRKHPQLRDVVKKTMFRIASGEHTSLAVHPLKGSMKGYFSARLSHAYRIIFTFTPESVTFINLGSHEEVY